MSGVLFFKNGLRHTGKSKTFIFNFKGRSLWLTTCMCAVYYHIEGFKFIQEQTVHSGYLTNCDIIKWIQVKRICTVKVSQEVIWCINSDYHYFTIFTSIYQ